jgi:hypothetical protein
VCYFVVWEVSLRSLDGRGVNGSDRVTGRDLWVTGCCDGIGRRRLTWILPLSSSIGPLLVASKRSISSVLFSFCASQGNIGLTQTHVGGWGKKAGDWTNSVGRNGRCQDTNSCWWTRSKWTILATTTSSSWRSVWTPIMTRWADHRQHQAWRTPSPFHTHTHTHLWRWSRHCRGNGVGRMRVVMLGFAPRVSYERHIYFVPMSHIYLAWLNNRWFYVSSETACVMDFTRKIEN